MHDFSIPAIHDTTLASRLDKAIANKTKPLGSLGMLETLAKQIGLIQQTTNPVLSNPTIAVFAADHGVVAEHISAYPQSVTWQMVENFLAGGAAINVFAALNNCALQIIDAGVNHDFGEKASLIDQKIGFGTRNFARQLAMTAAECEQAMQAGITLAESLSTNVLGFGDMGIGNTTSAAALMHLTTGAAVAKCVGAGAGLPDAGILHKQQVIERAVALHSIPNDPLAILAAFGGFEIAMMVGAMLAAAQRRMVLIIDGFIVTSALLVAAKIQPTILQYCVFAHASNENGHLRMLQYLNACPLLNLGMRLGEGTGCALALPLMRAAVGFLNEMATFESAQVSNTN